MPQRLVALRMLKAALMNREVERGRALDENESRQVVSALVKQRRDSIEQFTKGGRKDLADKETAEIAVLESYLPPAVDAADLERAVDDAIASTGASSAKDMGQGHEGGDGRAGGQDRRRQGRERAGPPQAGRRPSSRSPRQLVRSAGVIGIATMTSRVLGLVRDQVLAYFFGAGDAMDAFRIAFRLPNVLRDLFAEGAMSAALVPTFTRALATGDRDRRVAARPRTSSTSPADRLRRRRRRGHRCSPNRSCGCTPAGFAACPENSS